MNPCLLIYALLFRVLPPSIAHSLYPMRRYFQAISRFSINFPILWMSSLGTQPSLAKENESIIQKNIVVLIDQSKSVDAANRKSSLDLIAGLVEGKVPAEIRKAWKFQKAAGTKDDSDSAETRNLDFLFQENDQGSPISKVRSLFLIAGLGNYQRTVDIRNQLGTNLKSSDRSELAAIFRNSGDAYQAEDNSTHVTLAESILAESLLKADKDRGSYYLIVVSDFNEDCFNRPVSDYDDPKKPVVKIGDGKNITLAEANEQVFRGKLKFDDGNKVAGNYSSDDQKSIHFFREKVEQLLLGDFIYQEFVEQAKRPVRVQVYAHSPKRGLAFTTKKYVWNFPAEAPVLSWSAQGISPDTKLTVEIAGSARTISNEDITVDGDTYSYSLADHFSKPLPAGIHSISMMVEDPSNRRPLLAGAELSFIVPSISFSGKYENTSPETPASLERQTEIPDEKFEGELSPSPGTCTLRATLVCDGKSFANNKVKVDDQGHFILRIREFGDEAGAAVTSGKIVSVTVSFPHNEILAKDASSSAVCYLTVQKVEIWADGYPADEAIQLDLRKGLGVTFKSSHANIKGYTWPLPVVTFQGGQVPPAVRSRNNVITFSQDAPAGAYNVTMAMKFDGKEFGTKEFRIQIPKRTNWMPIILISMGLFSLGLFSWHFVQRR